MDAAASQSPRVLGRYSLHAEIASGGMATVHLGRLIGTGGFTKTVAIKCLHPQFAKDPEFAEMFLDEARLAARVQHPNVVSTLDVVALEPGDLFVVMEYIQGESLSRLMRLAQAAGRPIPPEVAVSIMVGALHGLHAAHDAVDVNGEPLHIVHRDVSPQNILVGKDGVARVLDFGVAKAANRATETRDGMIKGKLPYMAPEQFSGKVSRATDIYAASVVLWEALVGRRLFRGETEAETMRLVMGGDVRPPSELVSGLPRVLDDIVLRGLATDPKHRFATARDMARALEKSIPLVSATDVGEIVTGLAGSVLAERARLVAKIESGSVSVDRLSAAPASSPAVTQSVPQDRTTISSPEHGEPKTETKMESVSDGLLAPVRTGRARLVAGASVGISVAALLGLLAFRSSRAPEPASPAAPALMPDVATTVVAPVAASAPVPASTPAAASSAHIVETPPRAAPSTRPPASPAPRARPATRATPGTKPAPKTTPDCSPPYTVDAQGIRRYKRECE